MIYLIPPIIGLAYLLGAVPFGLIVVRGFKGIDLRLTGSGNIGATNAGRAGGWFLGILTLLFDVSKGALPVFLAAAIQPPYREMAMSLTAVAALLGHLFPVYLRFKTGGKGVATAAGSFLVLSPAALLPVFIMFAVTVALTRRVSAGSLTGAALLPFIVLFFERSLFPAGAALIVALLIVARHKDNISRLRKGNEPRIR